MTSEDHPDREPPFAAHRLPPGRHGLPPGYVTSNQRWRLLGATAEALAEHGYSHLTTAILASAAGVSPRTVYRHFENLDACVLAAYRTAAECVVDIPAGVCAEQPDRPERLRAALEAVLAFCASEPALARLLGLETTAAIAAIVPERERLIERLGGLLRAIASEDSPGYPPGTEERLVAAAIAFLAERLRAGGAERLPQLAPQLTELLGAPGAD